jgi:hypothetical protein
MAVVQGIREKVHLPIYDSIHVKPQEQLRNVANGGSSTLKFFVDVQRKTKLETNLQSASLLPHYNTFEARAMRVVISDLPPEFPQEVNLTAVGVTVEEEEEEEGGGGRKRRRREGEEVELTNLNTNLPRVMELLEEASENDPREIVIRVGTDGIEDGQRPLKNVRLTVLDLEKAIFAYQPEGDQPPEEQIRPNNGLIGKLIYNTVTTLYVGEKIMIQMPTWFFPAGAGPYSETAAFTTHGEPSPTATFRFAEPVFIDKQQNFRVEIEIPDTDVLKEVQKIYGPLFIWVVLDGYMVRDVQ